MTGETNGLLAFRTCEDFLVEVLGQSDTLTTLVGTRTRERIPAINQGVLVLEVMQLVENYRVVKKEQLQVLLGGLRHTALRKATYQVKLLVDYMVLEPLFSAVDAKHVPAWVKLKCVQSVRAAHWLTLAE